MIAFDADILTELLAGQPVFVAKAATIPAIEQTIPIIVIEELLRGRLNAIRQAESGHGRLPLPRAYELLAETQSALRAFRPLLYLPAADDLYREWRASKLKGGTHDLRIAAICVVHSATLVTRNRRDFDGLPGLNFDTWG